MRAFVLVCFIATATAQYNYVPLREVSTDDGSTGSTTVEQAVIEEYNKSFYSYFAPEQDFEDSSVGEQIENTVKRSLRIIFIKGPENIGLENAVLQLAKGAADDRTAIYVLSKQTDVGALANQVEQLKVSNAVKPEVNFVKYRTQADAENAQRAIQAQYDNVPGATVNSDAGSASVLDFASKSVEASTVNNAATSATAAASTATRRRAYTSARSSYLPPSKRF